MASLDQRGTLYYIQYFSAANVPHQPPDRLLQIAKEKLRQFESAQLRGDDNPLPPRTPDCRRPHRVRRAHPRVQDGQESPRPTSTTSAMPSAPSAMRCKVTSRKLRRRRKRQPSRAGPTPAELLIEAPCFEQITTPRSPRSSPARCRAAARAQDRQPLPRDPLPLFNWAIDQHGIRCPATKTPLLKVRALQGTRAGDPLPHAPADRRAARRTRGQREDAGDGGDADLRRPSPRRIALADARRHRLEDRRVSADPRAREDDRRRELATEDEGEPRVPISRRSARSLISIRGRKQQRPLVLLQPRRQALGSRQLLPATRVREHEG